MSMSDRGFASMDPAMRKNIARMGGIAAHKKGVAHEWTVETARIAGRKGGLSLKRRKRPVEPTLPLDGHEV